MLKKQIRQHEANIIIALDFANKDEAMDFVKKLDPKLCQVKVGSILFTAAGPDFIKWLQDLGFDVFLDLKFHDIPNTVEFACYIAANLGVWMLTVHTMGGLEMLLAAKRGVAKSAALKKPIIMGVTVLTSIAPALLLSIGINNTITDQVLLLAGLAYEANLDGVVCSGLEANLIKTKYDNKLKLLTPGIYIPDNKSVNYDQKRVFTPKEAIEAGSDYLVIGRAVLKAVDPMAVLNKIILDLKS